MHNLFILGSPRKNGNSETMAQAVAAGLLKNKDTDSVEFIRLNTLQIKPCQACGGCSSSGNCIIDDDMNELYRKTDDSDRLFFVSPVYFYGLTAQIKSYIDRCQARWSRKYLLGKPHRPTEQRTGHLLSCAATNGKMLFEGSIISIKSVCDTLDLTYGKPLLIRNLEPCDALKNLPEEVTACERYGMEIASTC